MKGAPTKRAKKDTGAPKKEKKESNVPTLDKL
jgi:hypothetical protein